MKIRMERKKEYSLQGVKCNSCEVQYYIKWVNLADAKKYDHEWCPNCGETDFLELLGDIKVKEV